VNLLVNVDVDDLAAAESFYASVFGLRPGRRLGDGGVEMLGAAAPIWLLAKLAGTAPSPTATDVRRYGRHWTPVHLDFVVAEIDVAVAGAIAAGALLETPVSTHEWGRIAVMADPFGHGFCFVQFLGRGYDEIATPP
jgi:predicted enzyme related to lactoylglutathione lyase